MSANCQPPAARGGARRCRGGDGLRRGRPATVYSQLRGQRRNLAEHMEASHRVCFKPSRADIRVTRWPPRNCEVTEFRGPATISPSRVAVRMPRIEESWPGREGGSRSRDSRPEFGRIVGIFRCEDSLRSELSEEGNCTRIRRGRCRLDGY